MVTRPMKGGELLQDLPAKVEDSRLNPSQGEGEIDMELPSREDEHFNCK